MKDVQQGKFRSDLLSRICCGSITVPPLRERRSDIPQLIQYFLKKFNLTYDRDITLTDRVIARLQSHLWLGNVRELKNLIEKSCGRTDKTFVDLEDIEELIGTSNDVDDWLRSLPDPYEGFSLDDFLKQVRHYYMRKAMEVVGGQNKSAAARLLDKDEKAFHKYWKEHAEEFSP